MFICVYILNRRPRTVCAPMVEQSELAFRLLCRSYNKQLISPITRVSGLQVIKGKAQSSSYSSYRERFRVNKTVFSLAYDLDHV